MKKYPIILFLSSFIFASCGKSEEVVKTMENIPSTQKQIVKTEFPVVSSSGKIEEVTISRTINKNESSSLSETDTSTGLVSGMIPMNSVINNTGTLCTEYLSGKTFEELKQTNIEIQSNPDVFTGKISDKGMNYTAELIHKSETDNSVKIDFGSGKVKVFPIVHVNSPNLKIKEAFKSGKCNAEKSDYPECSFNWVGGIGLFYLQGRYLSILVNGYEGFYVALLDTDNGTLLSLGDGIVKTNDWNNFVFTSLRGDGQINIVQKKNSIDNSVGENISEFALNDTYVYTQTSNNDLQAYDIVTGKQVCSQKFIK